jgi:hypothetical protein
MSRTEPLPVSELKLDLHNFRTVPQPDELSAVHALIAIDTDWFWALMENLLDDGYLPTENIIESVQRERYPARYTLPPRPISLIK